MDFDQYFGRFRCFNPDCGWMATSSTEREIRLLRSQKKPQRLGQKHIEELDITLTCDYDSENDAIVADFGLNEPAFDLPEEDGIMIWKISHRTGSVTGFIILGAKEFHVSEVSVDVAVRKESIERGIKCVAGAISGGRATKFLVEKVLVETHRETQEVPRFASEMKDAFNRALNTFSTRYLNNEISERDHVPL